MLKKAAILLALFFILPLSFAEITSIRIERNIEGAVSPGETVDATLEIKFRGTKTGSIIVTEELPEGWTLAESTPSAYNFGEGKYKWLLYEEPMQDTTIYYTLKAPQSFNEMALISGKWITLEDGGVIEGDGGLQPKEVTTTPSEGGQIPPPPAVDNMLLMIAGAIIAVIIIIAVFFVLRKKKPAGAKK